jgi:hypothetical protein
MIESVIGRDVRLGHRGAAEQRRRRGREQARHFVVLDEGRQSDHELTEALAVADALQGRKAVDGHAVRLELVDLGLHRHQVVLEAGHLGIGR